VTWFSFFVFDGAVGLSFFQGFTSLYRLLQISRFLRENGSSLNNRDFIYSRLTFETQDKIISNKRDTETLVCHRSSSNSGMFLAVCIP